MMNRDHRDGQESAFTLVEMLVVLIILAIMGVGVIYMTSGARKAGNVRTAIAIATQYGGAIDDFIADNGGLVPVTGTTTYSDWRTTTGFVERGPRNWLQQEAVAYYVRTMPAEVKNGAAKVCAGGASCPYTPGGPGITMHYQVGATAYLYRIRMAYKGQYICSVSNDPAEFTPSGRRRC